MSVGQRALQTVRRELFPADLSADDRQPPDPADGSWTQSTCGAARGFRAHPGPDLPSRTGLALHLVRTPGDTVPALFPGGHAGRAGSGSSTTIGSRLVVAGLCHYCQVCRRVNIVQFFSKVFSPVGECVYGFAMIVRELSSINIGGNCCRGRQA